MPTDANKARPGKGGKDTQTEPGLWSTSSYATIRYDEPLFICILTFYSQRQLIADRFALVVNGTARIISSIMFGDLLQHQALIGAYYACRCVVLQVNTLQSTMISG